MIRRDPYQVLGIGRDASPEVIRRAYHRLVIQYHPDRNPDDSGAAERLREVVAAYELLSDPKKKMLYDRHGGPVEPPSDGAWKGSVTDVLRNAVTDLFEELSSRSQNRKRGHNVSVVVQVDFEEAVLGVKKTIRFDAPVVCPVCHGLGGNAAKPGAVEICPTCSGRGRVPSGPSILGLTRECPRCNGKGRIVRQPCEQCSGTGRVTTERKLDVTLPPGVMDGAVRMVKGEGGPGESGGEPGDLEIVVRVAEHPLLRRRGRDVVCVLPLSVTDAILGAKVKVPTVRGAVNIDIPPGLSHKTTIRIKGRGVVDNRGSGDQLVEVELELPKELDDRQVAAVRRLAETLTDRNLPASSRFRRIVSGGEQ